MRWLGMLLVFLGGVCLAGGTALALLLTTPTSRSALIKERLAEVLQEKGYAVAWEKAKFNELSSCLEPYRQTVTREKRQDVLPHLLSSSVAFRSTMADMLKRAKAIHFLELDTGEALFLLEQSHAWLPLNSCIHHHDGRWFSVVYWYALRDGFNPAIIANALPFEELSTIKEWLRKRAWRRFLYALGIGLPLLAGGTAVLVIQHALERKKQTKGVAVDQRDKVATIAHETPSRPVGHALEIPLPDKKEKKGGKTRELKNIPLGWEEALDQLQELISHQTDSAGREELEEIRTRLLSSDDRTIGRVRFYLSRARRIAAEMAGGKERTEFVFSTSSGWEKQLALLAPIVPIVQQERPDLDPDIVLATLFWGFRLWSGPFFGERYRPVQEVKRGTDAKIKKRHLPKDIEESLRWLKQIGVVMQNPGKDNIVYSLNPSHSSVPPPANKIIRVLVNAAQELQRRLR